MSAIKEKMEKAKANIPCLSAVAGPFYCRFAFLFLCVVSFILFLVSLVPKLGEWKENKVSTEQTVMDEMDFPDMYYCHSAGDTFVLDRWPLPNTVPTGYNAVGDDDTKAALFTNKFDPSQAVFGNGVSVISKDLPAENTCELSLLDDSYIKFVKCAGKTLVDSSSEITAADKASLEALRVARSRDLLGKTYEHGIQHTAGTVIKPGCALFKIDASVKAKRTGTTPTYVIWEGRLTNAYNQDIVKREATDGPDTDFDSFPVGEGLGVNGFDAFGGRRVEVYYTKPGVSPVKDGVIVAPMSLVPLSGTSFVATLSYREVKDKTAGDKDFRRQYTIKTSSIQTRNRNDLNKLQMVFRINDFHVDKVTIDSYSFGDIWADLGGLWAASLIVIAFFFGKSGRINENGYELQIWKYMPDSMRKEYLEGSNAKPEAKPDPV